MKPGIGLVVNLKQTATVASVTLTGVSQGGTVQLKTGDPAAAADAPAVAETQLVNGDTTITLDKPAQVDRIILWFPQLPTDTQTNKLRVALSAIAVK